MAFKPSILQNRVALCGDPGSGKTCLFESLQSHPFDPSYNPTVIATYANIPDPSPTSKHPAGLNIWDTTGNAAQRYAVAIYVRKIDVAIITTDLLNAKGVSTVRSWLQTVQMLNTGERRPTMVIARTKADQAMEPAEEEGLEDLKKRFGCEGFFVSAQSGTGVDELRMKLMEYCNERRLNPPPPSVEQEVEQPKCNC
jgi:small GTP-binding protein